MTTILIACVTSYHNCGHEISIPLDVFCVIDYFFSKCYYRITIDLVGQAPE